MCSARGSPPKSGVGGLGLIASQRIVEEYHHEKISVKVVQLVRELPFRIELNKE